MNVQWGYEILIKNTPIDKVIKHLTDKDYGNVQRELHKTRNNTTHIKIKE